MRGEEGGEADDRKVATSIGAGIAVLSWAPCSATHRNSAGVWDVFVSIVTDFFLTMVSFGFEIIDILTDWFAYLQLIDSSTARRPSCSPRHGAIATSSIVSVANVVVRLVVAYKMSTEATTLSNARKRKLGAADGLKGSDSSNSAGDLTNNAMNLSDMRAGRSEHRRRHRGDVVRMDLDELVGNGITVSDFC